MTNNLRQIIGQQKSVLFVTNSCSIQSCPGGAPGRTHGCIRSAVGWCCIPPPPPVGIEGGESAAHEFTS